MSTPLGLQNSEEGADQPVVLRTSMIPDEILSKAFIWHAEPFLHYTLPGSLGLLKTEVSKRLFTEVLAPRLLSDRGFVTGVHDEDSTNLVKTFMSEFLGRLLLLDMVKQSGHQWHFSELGKNSLVVGTVLTGGRMACARQNLRHIPANELTVFEMIRLLSQEGWEHMEADSRKDRRAARCTSYMGGKARCAGRVFYTIGKHNSICKFDLQALVSYGEHKQAVPHLAASKVYKLLLGIDVPQAPARSKGPVGPVEESWEALEKGDRC